MTKFLIDENLPVELRPLLAADAVHARELGSRRSDAQLWDYARTHDYIIVTKDADYFNKLSVQGAPRKVVWVRTGNLRLSSLLAHVAQHWPAVVDLLQRADLVIVHSDRVEGIVFSPRT